MSTRVHVRRCKKRTCDAGNEAEWIRKRRRVVKTMVASTGGSSSSNVPPRADSLSRSLWTQKQTKEIELQNKRVHANSEGLSQAPIILLLDLQKKHSNRVKGKQFALVFVQSLQRDCNQLGLSTIGSFDDVGQEWKLSRMAS